RGRGSKSSPPWRKSSLFCQVCPPGCTNSPRWRFLHASTADADVRHGDRPRDDVVYPWLQLAKTSMLKIAVPFRIVLENPPAGVDFALQKGKGNVYEIVQKQRSTGMNLVFEF